MKQRLLDIASVLFGVAGIVSVVNGVFRFWTDDPTTAGIPVAAGIALMFAANIDRFELLKIFGLEARTRELKETIHNAQEVAERLKTLTDVAARGLLRLSVKEPNAKQQDLYELSRTVKGMLEQNGASVESQRDALEPWLNRAAGGILGQIIYVTLDRWEASVQELWKRQRHPPADGSDWAQAPDLRAVLDQYYFLKGGSTSPTISGTAAKLKALADFQVPETLSAAERAGIDDGLRRLRAYLDTWLPQVDAFVETLDFPDERLWKAALYNTSITSEYLAAQSRAGEP